jgi:hypothetical protein
MQRTNEPDARPAPRVFLGRTAAGHVLRVGESVPDTVAQQVAAVVDRFPPASALRLPPAALAPVREALERHAPVTAESGGPAYRFPAAVAPPGEAVRVTAANLDVVRYTYPWLLEALAAWSPCFAVVRDGAAVSVCFTSRIGDRAMEAGLETLLAFRGRGYATAATAAWGAYVAGTGRIPLYSTGWDNLASQGVARRVGLITFGADATWA